MMLQSRRFDNSPHTREIIYNFMRLRALRVEVDTKLALREFTLEQAAKYLHEKVPMDEQGARQEAIAFATGPGQAIDYQTGKLQILRFWPKRECNRARSLIYARSTISCGKTATSQFRCSSGNTWAMQRRSQTAVTANPRFRVPFAAPCQR